MVCLCLLWFLWFVSPTFKLKFPEGEVGGEKFNFLSFYCYVASTFTRINAFVEAFCVCIAVEGCTWSLSLYYNSGMWPQWVVEELRQPNHHLIDEQLEWNSTIHTLDKFLYKNIHIDTQIITIVEIKRSAPSNLYAVI